VAEEGLNGFGGIRAEEVITGNIRQIRERTEGTQECRKARGDVGGVPDEE